jgi:hypothetical protein
MFDHALYDLNHAMRILPGYLQACDAQVDISHIYEPLFLALQMLYEQGPRPELFRLRVKIAHFLDVTLLLLLQNDGFRLAFADRRVPGLYGHIAAEHRFLQHHGFLSLQEQQQQQAAQWGGQVPAPSASASGSGSGSGSGSVRLPRYSDFLSGNHNRSNRNNRSSSSSSESEDGTVVIPEEVNFALQAADSAVRTHDATLASMRRQIEVRHQLAAERDAAHQRGTQLSQLHRAVGLQPHQQLGPAGAGRGLGLRRHHHHHHHHHHHSEEVLALRREESHFGRLNADFNASLDATQEGRRTIGGPSGSGRSGVGAVMVGGEGGGGGGDQKVEVEGEGEGGDVESPSPPQPPSTTTTARGEEDRSGAAAAAAAASPSPEPSPGPGGGGVEDESAVPVPVGGEEGGSSSPSPDGRHEGEGSSVGAGSGSSTGGEQRVPPPPLSPSPSPPFYSAEGSQVSTEEKEAANARRSWWETVMGGEEGEGARGSWWDVIMAWATDGGGG